MKVCTDACFFGACIANIISNSKSQISNCLDIGAGTGLLSLMIAQKTSTVIDAIEIEEDAFDQAKENFSNSPWSQRLRAFHTDVKHFVSAVKYDFIISNPPFYQNDLVSPLKTKNVAKHNTGLNVDELIGVIKNLLSKSGSFAVLLPYHRIAYFEKLANENYFFLNEKLLLKPTPEHDYIRGFLLFSQTNKTAVIKELIIKNKDGKYTDDFVGLMSEYYLAL
jgi:tRNA1Val (adenine37-N6)-methyltransferase